MRIDGRWMVCSDGFERPIVPTHLLLPDGQTMPVPMLLDTGADFTFLTYTILQSLNDYVHAEQPPAASGVGGDMPIALVNVDLMLQTNTGKMLKFRGPIQAFASPTSFEISVMGRDVLDRFEIVYARSRNLIALITAPDSVVIMQIASSS